MGEHVFEVEIHSFAGVGEGLFARVALGDAAWEQGYGGDVAAVGFEFQGDGVGHGGKGSTIVRCPCDGQDLRHAVQLNKRRGGRGNYGATLDHLCHINIVIQTVIQTTDGLLNDHSRTHRVRKCIAILKRISLQQLVQMLILQPCA